MNFRAEIFLFFSLVLACEKTIKSNNTSSGPTASDGTPCIRVDSSSCIIKEGPVTVILEPFISLVNVCSGFCTPTYYPQNKFNVDNFNYEWGYAWKLDTISSEHYIPDTSEGTIQYKTYEFKEVVSKEPVSPGFEFFVRLDAVVGSLSSGLDYFQEKDGKMFYVDKPFRCLQDSICTNFFNIKQKIIDRSMNICFMKITLRFQDKPEDDLIFAAVETEICK